MVLTTPPRPPPVRECLRVYSRALKLETRCVGFRPTLPREESFSLGFDWGGRKSPYCVFTRLLYTSPSPRDATLPRMPSSA